MATTITPANGIHILPRAESKSEPIADPEPDPIVVIAKELRRHKWLAVPLAALFGVGGAGAGIYGMSDQASANAAGVKANALKSEQNSKDIGEIKHSVSGVSRDVDKVQATQVKVLSGIEELKSENVNQLKEELAEARRELRGRRER